MRVDLSALLNMGRAALFVAVAAMFGVFLFDAPSRKIDRRASDVVTIVDVRKLEVAPARLPTSSTPQQPYFADAFAASSVARPSDAMVEIAPAEPPDTPLDPGAIRGNEDRTGPPYGLNEGIGGIPDTSVFGPAPSTVGSLANLLDH